jgi:hypothetical protein
MVFVSIYNLHINVFENLLLNTLGQNVVLLFEIIETGVLILIQAKTSMKIDILIAKKKTKKTQPSHGITYIYIYIYIYVILK